MKMEGFTVDNPHKELLKKDHSIKNEIVAQYHGHTGQVKPIGGVSSVDVIAANEEDFIEEKSKRSLSVDKYDPETRAWILSIPSYRDYRTAIFLLKKGLLKKKEKVIVADLDLIKNFPFKHASVTKKDVYACLHNLGLIDSSLSEESFDGLVRKENSNRGRLTKEVLLPQSFNELIKGESTSGEIFRGKTGEGWLEWTHLPDGTKTTVAEIEIAKKYGEVGAERGSDGKLYATKGERAGKKISLNDLTEGKGFKWTQKGVSSQEFFYKYIPNLKKMGIINEGDFRVTSTKKEAYVIQLKEKSPLVKDVSLRNSVGTSKYYFGADKYVHNGEKMSEHVSIAVLDDKTGGIFEEENGIKVLKYLFPLITGIEIEKEKFKIAAHLHKEINDLTPSELTSNARKKLSKEDIENYKVTKYLAMYRNESPEEYAERVSEYKNAESVINAINSIFSGADLNHLSVSWATKMRLAEALKRLKKEEVIDFAKTFGIEGLQMLLASDADKMWPKELMNISREKEYLMRQVYEKYAPLLTDEEEFKQSISSVTENTEAMKYVADSRRASLQQVIDEVRKIAIGELELGDTDKKSSGDVFSQRIIFKALRQSGVSVSLEDIKGVDLVFVDAKDIDPRDASAMRRIYETNYAESPDLQKILLKGFDESIEDPEWKNRFQIFRHNGEVRGFYKLEKQTDKISYFGSFNIDSTYGWARLGEAILEQSLDHDAESTNIEADCNQIASISAYYIEHGFIGVKQYAFAEDQALSIVRNDEMKELIFESTDLSIQDIKDRSKIGETISSQDGKFTFASQTLSNISEIPFGVVNEIGENGERYVLTRYLREKNDSGQGTAYVVFEKVSQRDLERYVNRENPYKEKKSF